MLIDSKSPTPIPDILTSLMPSRSLLVSLSILSSSISLSPLFTSSVVEKRLKILKGKEARVNKAVNKERG